MKPLTPAQYRKLRQSLGTQTKVGAMLGVDLRTIQRREAGTVPITLEMTLAIKTITETMGRESRNEGGK